MFNLGTIPQTKSNYNQTKQKEDFVRMWRNLQQFQGEKTEGKQKVKINKTQKNSSSYKKPKGFQGGEYIDYEEM